MHANSEYRSQVMDVMLRDALREVKYTLPRVRDGLMRLERSAIQVDAVRAHRGEEVDEMFVAWTEMSEGYSRFFRAVERLQEELGGDTVPGFRDKCEESEVLAKGDE